MIYRVRHRSTYSYANESTYARCVLRLRPEDSASQSVLEFSVETTPPAASVTQRTGAYGETVLMVIVDTPHDELVIEANSIVDVRRHAIDEKADSPAWEDIRRRALMVASVETDSPASYLYPTPRTPLQPSITEYGRLSFPPARPVVAGVADLMRRIHDDFAYDPDATAVSTPAAEAFAARRGVCQDFTHITISALRGLGLPAAYVSGYLRTRPISGRKELTGSDASHAWVNVWCGAEIGWVGFDPTNAVLVRDDHIVIAMGRDYADVAPIDGILLGPGEQGVAVEVDVIPSPELVIARPDFAQRQSHPIGR